MKKGFLCAALIVCINAIGFSQEETQSFSDDMWFSLGASFGNTFMNGTGQKSSYIGSPGFNVAFSLFGKKNIGYFYNFGMLFPVANNAGQNYDPSAQLDYIVGICFGYDINEALKLYCGIGPNINMIFLHTKENGETYGDYSICLGMGGDIGIKYKFRKNLSIDFGTTVSQNIAAYRTIRSNVDYWHNQYTVEESGWGWVNKFTVTTLKPYVLFGFNVANVARLFAGKL